MKNSIHNKPPKIAERILSFILPDKKGETPLGDFEEFFNYRLRKEGRSLAVLWYWKEIIKILFEKINNNIFGGAIMLNNYFKTAIRNILRNKGYSFINITGLAIGMASCILILLWVQYEISFDDFYKDADRIYRIVDYEKYSDGKEYRFTSNAPGLAPVLKKDFPEIESVVRYSGVGELLVNYKNNRFNEYGVAFVDENFLEVFNFQVISGDKETPLKDPNSMIITTEMANKYFGTENPLGKVLILENMQKYIITATIEKLPENTHLRANFLVPFNSIKNFGYTIEGWQSYYLKTYIKLKSNINIAEFNNKIKDVVKKYDEEAIVEISAQPIKEIHLYSKDFASNNDGDIKYIFIFIIIAGFVLLTACINFMNLSTARSVKRAKEIGIRKAVGAVRSELIKQFYGESFILTMLSLAVAVLLVNVALPFFNLLTNLNLNFNLIHNSSIVVILVLVSFITALVSGSYPALFLSSFEAVKVISGKLTRGMGGAFFRKVLVTFQFCLTISLIIGTIIINKQLHYIRNQNLGYNKEQVLCVDLKNEVRNNVSNLKTELSKINEVVSLAGANTLPSSIRSSTVVSNWQGQNPGEKIWAHIYFSDYDLIKTLDMNVVSGRYFSREFVSDTTNGVVINRAAAKAFGWADPIGKSVLENSKVIGVIDDFNFESLHHKINPLIIMFSEDNYKLMIKINSPVIFKTVEQIKTAWMAMFPEYPFEHEFLDESIERSYRSDLRIEKLINYFTFLIIFIAALGLFGLSSFMVEQRTKEIGIRKVLGAPVGKLVVMLSKEFIKWVAVANIISWPIVYFVMSGWLENYAYKTEINFWLFLVGGGIAILIAFLTVSFQVVKASLANPVASLKYE